MKKQLLIITLLLISIGLNSCRKDESIVPSTTTPIVPPITPGEQGNIVGFFLLNEGNMGNNKATLDHFDYQTGVYTKNIYAERNPGVAGELGDVGNDLQIYGDKLYAVINCSNFVEVMDVNSAKHIGTVSIPNCRYIVFHGKYAYVSSYAGPVSIDPNARLGYVAKVDTATLKVVAECVVGYQPEEMVIRDDKLYVANSGGYRVPDYDNTVSVINLADFKEEKKITVAINLYRLELDNYGNIYVSSRGDYKNIRSNTYIINSSDIVSDNLKLPSSDMTLCGDSLYLYSTEWNHALGKNSISYAIVNTKTKTVISRNFISDGTEKRIEVPYGLAVNPQTREILVADAKDYITPGTLYCFNADGTKRWNVETGDIPAHIVFTRKKLTNK